MRLPILSMLLLTATLAATNAQAPKPADQPLPATAADGSWRGKSDAGSCNQPMDVTLTIEGGLVEGTGRESAGKTALLWSYHGRAKPNGTVELLGHASAFPPQNGKQATLAGRIDGGRITLAENGGCGRSMTLSR